MDKLFKKLTGLDIYSSFPFKYFLKKISFQNDDYQNFLRENYEKKIVFTWIIAAIVLIVIVPIFSVPTVPILWTLVICFFLCIKYIKPAYKLDRIHKSLEGKPLEFLKFSELEKLTPSFRADKLTWLGYGFKWEKQHIQRATDILKHGELANMKIEGGLKELAEGDYGKKWLHGVEVNEERVLQPLKHLEGHTIIYGTPGSGKTRMLDLLINQEILRKNRAIIVVDPKGDLELKEHIRLACIANGTPERFANFHPAFPEESIKINPLANYNEPRELASRISALIPSVSGGGLDPFQAFGWQAINVIVGGLVILENRPTLRSIKRYLQNGVDGLIFNVLAEFINKTGSIEFADNKEKIIQNTSSSELFAPPDAIKELINLYTKEVSKVYQSDEIEALISMYIHDRTHFSKMISSLIPIMNMLTNGHLGDLLSPSNKSSENYAGFTDNREITDFSTLIANNRVVYIGLDSLTDSQISSAICSLFCADLAGVAGAIYNFKKPDEIEPIYLYVDETSEVVNEPYIQILNKGRGAGFVITMATQTFSDLAKKLGGDAAAHQILGNINNTIAFRTKDTITQEQITKPIPKTQITTIMKTQSTTTSSHNITFSGNIGERLSEVESDLFPPQFFSSLPNLEYFAFLSGGVAIKGRIPILIGHEI